eukprot:7636150-Lingulodinium_polyedra.AAC.1
MAILSNRLGMEQVPFLEHLVLSQKVAFVLGKRGVWSDKNGAKFERWCKRSPGRSALRLWIAM